MSLVLPDPEYVFADELYETDETLPRLPLLQKSGERPSVLKDAKLHLVDSLDDCLAMFEWLGKRRKNTALAVDTETSGLQRGKDVVRLIQIGDMDTAWSIPAERWAGAALEALDKWDGTLLFHNSPFDCGMLEYNYGWVPPWHRIRDTMVAAHSVDPTQSLKLKNLAVRLIDRRAAVGESVLHQSMVDNGWVWGTVPYTHVPYWAYGSLDCILTAHLDDIFQAHVKYAESYELEMAMQRVAYQTENNGMRVDVPYCEQQLEMLDAYVAKLKKWGKDEIDTSLGSTQQLVRYFTEQGAEVTRFSDRTGGPSVDKEQLRLWLNDRETSENVKAVARTVLEMRKYQKLSTSYFKNLINSNVDGVVHPSIRTLGARTSRMSIAGPALQTLPKGSPIVRNAFIPHNEEQYIITCDYSQIEFRLLAHFSGDTDLIEAFRVADEATARGEDSDFFTIMGRQIYRDPHLTKNDKRRTLVKGVLYGRAYCAGVAKMAESAGVPEEHMRSVVDTLDANFPGITRFQREIEVAGQERLEREGVAYIVTPTGRRLPADETSTYALCNYLLQGHAAEIMKKGAIAVDMAGLGGSIINFVHDEMILSVSKDTWRKDLQTVSECMEMLTGYKVPLRVGPEGPFERWGGEAVEC